jgi:hypothetical protein
VIDVDIPQVDRGRLIFATATVITTETAKNRTAAAPARNLATLPDVDTNSTEDPIVSTQQTSTQRTM